MDPATVKGMLATAFASVAGVAAASPNEPRQAPDMPFVSIMTSSFRARGLETPVHEGLTDPVGGRVRVWRFSVRLWVSLKTDEIEAQAEIDTLLPLMQAKLDEDPSLLTWSAANPKVGVEDSTLEHGDVGTMNDNDGQPMLVALCEAVVSWTERTS